ncbi:MAG: group II truncated hemoglobin [bacterium]
MTNPPTPTLFEWVGGMPALENLTARFYESVKADALIGPVFAHMSSEHPRFVAEFIAEVFGGPTTYSDTRGGHAHMVTQHLQRHLTQAQRERWFSLLLTTANEVGIPDDPEFRSALVGYLEWGSRLAVLNSQPGVEAPAESPMPKWGWGVPGGPYQP